MALPREGNELSFDRDIKPELVRDLVSLIISAEADNACQVLVFTSADPDLLPSPMWMSAGSRSTGPRHD